MYNGIVEYIKTWTTLVVEFKYENINKMTNRLGNQLRIYFTCAPKTMVPMLL
jgi:hypothetical protein